MSPEQEWLDSLQGSGIRPGLDRMRRLARAAGDPHRAYVSSLIAGTNGKGSTAATLASIVERSGVRVGLYTSPHLVRINERWRVGGTDLDDAALDQAIDELRSASRKAGITPTYFEALTMIAFLAFRSAGCEHAVLEVGMGGRLDATNIVRPVVSLITNVAMDHQEFLGNTRARIAREKAGIIHRGCIAVTAADDEVVLRVLRRRAHSMDVPLHVIREETTVDDVRVDEAGTEFELVTPRDTYQLRSPLMGVHQVHNVSLAVRAAEMLAPTHGVSPTAIRRGVAQTRWRGRAERFSVEGRTVVVDGAHNPAGSEALAAHIESSTPSPRTLVFAAMRDKEWRAMLARLAPLFDAAVFTVADHDRGEDPNLLGDFGRTLGLVATVQTEVDEAFKFALTKGDAKTVVVAGSLYLAGLALPWLDRRS